MIMVEQMSNEQGHTDLLVTQSNLFHLDFIVGEMLRLDQRK